MMVGRFPIIVCCLITLIGMSCSTTKQLQTQSDKPFVVLKLDDLWNEKGLVHPGWLQVVDFLNEENVTGTIGLVCESLEDPQPEYIQWIKQRYKEGYEIWHHGYCHCKPMIDQEQKREFRGTNRKYQVANLLNAHNLVKEKLGITMRSFGAPYNSTDEFTPSALAELSDIKVWMYKETQTPTDKFTIKRISEVNIEYPVHSPNLEKLKAGYEKYKNEPILIIQGHPRSWVEEPERFEIFKQIVLFLKSEGVRFTTPYAYYQMQQL